MNSPLVIAAAVAALSATLSARPQAPAPAAPAPPVTTREIIKITGDLYRARSDNGFYSLFLVTPEGIILADPISTPFAEWLKAELARQFKVPVRYVIYSHGHYDHIEGGAAFADTARFIAHEYVLREMDGRVPHFPGNMRDTNKNGRLDADEAVGRLRAQFERLDRDGDKSMTSAEYWQEVRRPDTLYSGRMTITLGGKTVQLMHPGPNHSVDATVLLFPAERVVFAVDFATDIATPPTSSIRILPAAVPEMDSFPMRSWIATFKAIEALDFDTFVGGEGLPATKAEFAAKRAFFEDVVNAVTDGMARGLSLEELQKTVTLDKYRSWTGYEQRRAQLIASVLDNLRNYR